jgi:glycosyltransferase involved in cell wall biosynthesis
MNGGATPDVAVVIPTRNRDTRLTFALEALAEQTLAPDRFEVIVVRDLPAEGLGLEVPEALDLRTIELDTPELPAAKRNEGWRATTAPLIVFTDDDCRPPAEWLERLLGAWEERGRPAKVVLQGRTEPDPDEAHLLQRLARSQTITGPTDWYQCCNIAYPRSLLEEIGGFDPEFGFGGEDTDLGLRAVKSGAELVFVDEALTWHAVHPRGVTQAMRDGFAWDTAPLVLARHPEHREVILHRLFWKEAHEYLLLALAGVALANRTKGVSLLAAAPYVRWHWDRRVKPTPRRLAGYAAYLLERGLADGAEIAGTARAAIRHRTPLL